MKRGEAAALAALAAELDRLYLAWDRARSAWLNCPPGDRREWARLFRLHRVAWNRYAALRDSGAPKPPAAGAG